MLSFEGARKKADDSFQAAILEAEAELKKVPSAADSRDCAPQKPL